MAKVEIRARLKSLLSRESPDAELDGSEGDEGQHGGGEDLA